MYYVECECGQHLSVELFQAGTERTCRGCSSTVRVPSSSVLKVQSGDRYPHLSPLDKVLATSAALEPPFHGICHGCAEEAAEFRVPITLEILVERAEVGESGIRLGLDGVKFLVADTEEQRRMAQFPLLLCKSCRTAFEREQTKAGAFAIARNMSMFAVLPGFLYFAYHNVEAVAAIGGVLSVLGVFGIAVVALRLRDTKQKPHRMMRWLRGIRWVPEAIAAESEYKLTTGNIAAYDHQRVRGDMI